MLVHLCRNKLMLTMSKEQPPDAVGIGSILLSPVSTLSALSPSVICTQGVSRDWRRHQHIAYSNNQQQWPLLCTLTVQRDSTTEHLGTQGHHTTLIETSHGLTPLDKVPSISDQKLWAQLGGLSPHLEHPQWHAGLWPHCPCFSTMQWRVLHENAINLPHTHTHTHTHIDSTPCL